MKILIRKALLFIGLLTIITLMWQLLEFMYYGYIETRRVDSFIAVVLAYSLYYNLKKPERRTIKLSKVIPFPMSKGVKTPEEFVGELYEKIASGEVVVDKIAVVMQSPEGYVMTGYLNCDVGDKQLLASHIQVDAMWGIVKANKDQL